VTDAGDGLRSVNWTTGMLLTPDHFGAQDRYIQESFTWLLRYCIPGSGLLGGGVRADAAERGLGKHDPQLEVHDDGTTVSVAVLQARGVTPAGIPIEVVPDAPVRGSFAKADLAGATELLVYVVAAGDWVEDGDSVGQDDANPTQALWRLPKYELRLGVDADVLPRSLVVGKVRRASETLGFELDAQFIPSCAMIAGHSSLYAAWKRLQPESVQLAGQFAELHRAVAHYVYQVAQRGVDVQADQDVLAFIERAVMALDTSAYEILDPSMLPQELFQQIDRVGRRIAVALDLSASTRAFFQLLSGADAAYGALLEEERDALARGRELSPRADLGEAVARAEQTLMRIRRLVEALEGKYVDYRINRSVEAVTFLLDRGGEEFYVAAGTPGHPQREGDILTFVFSELRLSGQHEYRVVVTGDPKEISDWSVGEELRVDLRVNSETGPGRPISRKVPCEIPGQRNFAANFETPPDVATISGLNVTVQPGHRVRGAVLYQRRLGFAEGAVAPPPEPPSPRVAPKPEATAEPGTAKKKITIKPTSPPAAKPETPREEAKPKAPKIKLKKPKE
jgi:hypothetical protein